jgi:dihydrofolate reductase
MIKLVIIAAHDSNGVIGFNNQLPWSIPEDLAFFKRVTLGKPVIMGRKTHESIGFALPGRENIVVTSKASRQFKGCITSTSLEAAIAYCEHRGEEEAFIIGGAMLYAEAMKYAHKLLLTEIQQEFVGDAYFPRFDRSKFIETRREVHQCASRQDITFHFVTYEQEEIVRSRQETKKLQESIVEECRRHPLPGAHESYTRALSAVKQENPMTKKIKHPQHILVIDKEFTDELPGMALKHGINRLDKTQYEHWLEAAVSHLMTGQREKMEFDPRFRQILPYTPVIFSDTPDDIDWANSPLFLYQRTKKVGEERLAGNFSIGTGGHVDDEDVSRRESILNFKHTVATNLVREVAGEELEFKDGEVIVDPLEIPESWSAQPLFKFVPYGLIRDDSNNVGKVHLGVVNVIVVPTRFKVRCKEAELITCEPKTATELKASGLTFEGWTQILIDSFLDVPCSVEPQPRREVTLDMVMAQHFIESVEGDKWTELAIEFNTTVATLYRLNMGLFEVNEIPEGTRINVPEQPDLMVKVDTPQWLIDGLNNDTERARAKAQEIVGDARTAEAQARVTSSLLRSILDQGPDYTNCGLVFLVTQEMADRLAALIPWVSDLIKAGVVEIVEQGNLPGNAESIAVDPETAQHVKEGSVVWHFSDTPDAGVPREPIERSEAYPEMPNPTDVDLNDPAFNALWEVVKSWDVNVPLYYAGYCGANGSHVMLLLNVLRKLPGWSYTANVDVKNGNINVTGDLKLSDETLVDAEAGFHRAVKLGEENGTARHVLENGDSINAICEKYGIKHEDFERWNGFEMGHAWPTHTGYVFVADPAVTRAEDEFDKQYREGTRSL